MQEPRAGVDAVAVGALSQLERRELTSETIRRDLTDLQDDRLVRRVHGGAVRGRISLFESMLEVREGQNAEEKHRIAKAALAEVPDRGSLLIDSGSTAVHLAEQLDRDRDLTVITNSIPIIRSLATTPRPRVKSLVVNSCVRPRHLWTRRESRCSAT